jgi:PAS domain S-box-containing protein
VNRAALHSATSNKSSSLRLVTYYGEAALFIAVALFLSLLLRNKIPNSFAILLLAAVAASAWRGGAWVGFFAVILSSLGAAYFFFPPMHSFYIDRGEMPYFVLFVSSTAAVVWLISVGREAERRQSTYLDELLDNTADAVAMVGSDERVVRVNKEFSRMFGYTPEEVVGLSLNDLIVPEDCLEEAKQYSERVARAEIINVETIRQSKDGSRLQISLQRVPISVGTGEIASYSIYRDITARKRAEDAVRKSEERFSMAFRESPVTISLTSVRDYRYIEVNETFERLTGYTRQEVIGRTPFDLALWVDSSQRLELTGRLLKQGSLRDVESQFRTKDGRIWTGLSSVELIEIDDEPCSLFITLDITERKWAEQALRESEERFRLVANSAPVMIWMSGVDKLCTYFNQPWLDFTGRPLETELGNGWAHGVHPDDLARCLETYIDAFDRRQSFRMEYRLRRHDGEYRWVLDIGAPRANSDGSFEGYIGSCVDVTDRKKAEEALSRVSGRLIEAQEKERRRIARELHDDINQRLALLANGLQSLQEIPIDSPAEIRNRIKQLLTETWELSSDVHVLSHDLHSSKLETLGIVAAMRGFCRELAEQQRVTIDFAHSDVPDSLSPEVSLCLFRILQEGLRNAVKYSGEQRFEVRLRGISAELELTILDSGVGFDIEKVATHEGLGLISMRERVSLIKGTISITSKPLGGTEIKVRVPVAVSTHLKQLTTMA